MKTKGLLRLINALVCSLAFLSAQPRPGGGRLGAQEAILPQTHLAIESIRLDGDEVVVTALVSAGIKTVILESRPRVGSGNWEPRAVQRLGEFTTPVKVITIRVPRGKAMEMIQLRGETAETLPASFFEGASTKDLAVNGLGSADSAVPVSAVDRVAAAPEVAGDAGGGAARAVVESDIWKIDGDRLYFFNQYRGLQVIDIQDPDAPVILGAYNIPAAGEQMYLYDSNSVVLLARNNCGGLSTSAESGLILLDTSSGQPVPVVEIPVQGNIRESRLVGTALYLVSERYRPVLAPAKPEADGIVREVWEWGSEITSFDLSRFSDPIAKFSEWVPGYGNAIMATDRFLFVATPQRTSQWWSSNSDVRIFDISSPDGTTRFLASIPMTGRVKDKFNMNLNGDIFSAVTETADRVSRTQVETFSLASPASPSRLGALRIIDGETLHATRFHGDLLYAVTFMRIDPLWVIDLSDPARPNKVGELEIPGWSTYIQPLEGRLLTVGIDNTTGWRAAVQLFDVRDPARPALQSKIVLGEQYSSTEANEDEKAFGFIPEENLILVPYSSYDGGKPFQGVHLIDLDENGLRKRGSIDHEIQARRATVHKDRILSISGTELLTVDASDRDNPETVSTLQLSWGAERVFLEGGHLITASGSYDGHPTLRVVSTGDPSFAMNEVILTDLPLLGATLKNQKLFVMQGKSTEVLWPRIWNPTNYFPIATNDAVLALSVYDVSQLPEMRLLGESQTPFENKYWNQVDALWPKPEVLVWHSRNGGLYRGPLFLDVDDAVVRGAAFAVDERVSILPWWGGGDSQFIAYDVANAGAPRFLSEVNLRGTENWWNFGEAFAVNGLVYVSHQGSEYLPELRPPPTTVYRTEGGKSVPVVVTPPPGVWVQRYYLNVINFNNPIEPTVREPLNIPGALVGLARNGQLLYTQGYRYGDVEAWEDWEEWVDAIAYDGVDGRLVDSLRLPNTWPHPVLVWNGSVLAGRPTETKEADSTLEIWTLPDSGEFTLAGKVALASPVNDLRSIGDFVTFNIGSGIEVYDLTDPANPRHRGGGAPSGCVGYNIEFADGSLDSGLWIPLGPYGLGMIEIKPAQ